MAGKIKDYIVRIQCFLTVDIWRLSAKEMSSWRYPFINIIKKLYLAASFFFAKGTTGQASALTYSTMLATVPILAVVFGIASGFGFATYIEDWLRSSLSGHPQVSEYIISFVQSYLKHTHGGVILGVGLIFMLGTVLNLTRTIELTFNAIWQVKQERSLFRVITDYLTMFFIFPILIVLLSGISIYMTGFAKSTADYILLRPFIKTVINIMPYVIMSIAFTSLYVFMPNTHVKLKNAIFPGILAGVSMQFLQLFYVHGQMLLSSYNAIYGSFAALPLFMLWLQISWTICLFGAQLSYTSQNLDEFAILDNPNEISHRYRLMLCIVLLEKICKRFEEGKKPYSVVELKVETNIPIRVVNDLLYDLIQTNLVSTSINNEHREAELRYQPAESLDNITIGTLVDRFESLGKLSVPVDLNQQMKTESWKKILHLRKTYLRELRKIQIKDM